MIKTFRPFSVAAGCTAICLHFTLEKYCLLEREGTRRGGKCIFVRNPYLLCSHDSMEAGVFMFFPDEEVLFIISQSEGFTELLTILKDRRFEFGFSARLNGKYILQSTKCTLFFFLVLSVCIADTFTAHCSALQL